MRCPFCKTDEDRVIDSRSIGEGSVIRRRRKCLSCGKRFTTYERTEVAPRQVIKKDLSRESFKREKVLRGLMKACEKRSISIDQMENIVSSVEGKIFEEFDNEVSTKVVGEKVSEVLREVDHVAYVRFASVYREFKDVGEFLQEVQSLADAGGTEEEERTDSPPKRRSDEQKKTDLRSVTPLKSEYSLSMGVERRGSGGE